MPQQDDLELLRTVTAPRVAARARIGNGDDGDKRHKHRQPPEDGAFDAHALSAG